MRSLGIVALAAMLAGGAASQAGAADFDYRQAMRELVQAVSAAAKARNPRFAVIPQNGLELLAREGWPGSGSVAAYVAAIDGVAQEHVFYGMGAYDEPTPDENRDWLVGLLDFARAQGLAALVAEYAETPTRVNDAYARARSRGYVPFVAIGADYGLDRIPDYPARPVAVHEGDVTRPQEARNFLYLLNPHRFESAADFAAAVAATDYDMVVMDAFFAGRKWRPEELEPMRRKANGGRRLLIAYMNIGLAEVFRPYWQKGWKVGEPDWLAAPYEHELFPGEFQIRYWDPRWREILLGPGGYLAGLQAAGFDGTYLDNVESYLWWEARREEG